MQRFRIQSRHSKPFFFYIPSYQVSSLSTKYLDASNKSLNSLSSLLVILQSNCFAFVIALETWGRLINISSEREYFCGQNFGKAMMMRLVILYQCHLSIQLQINDESKQLFSLILDYFFLLGQITFCCCCRLCVLVCISESIYFYYYYASHENKWFNFLVFSLSNFNQNLKKTLLLV